MNNEQIMDTVKFKEAVKLYLELQTKPQLKRTL